MNEDEVFEKYDTHERVLAQYDLADEPKDLCILDYLIIDRYSASGLAVHILTKDGFLWLPLSQIAIDKTEQKIVLPIWLYNKLEYRET